MIARYFSQAANRTGPRGADGLCRWLGGHAKADSFRKQHPRRKIVPSHTSPRIATPGFESSFLRLRSLAPAGKRLVQGKAKQLIHEMYLSPTRKAALAAYERVHLLFSFYDFPAQQGDSTKDLEEIFNLIKE
jgi:hypothetical protein